jgi:hypothetical protein
MIDFTAPSEVDHGTVAHYVRGAASKHEAFRAGVVRPEPLMLAVGSLSTGSRPLPQASPARYRS